MKVRTKQSLIGIISGAHTLQCDIGNQQRLTGSVNTSSVYTEHNDPYSGSYSVTPSMEAKTLNTKGKLMTDDVTVQAVPVFRVSNNSGGTTVYIANEV